MLSTVGKLGAIVPKRKTSKACLDLGRCKPLCSYNFREPMGFYSLNEPSLRVHVVPKGLVCHVEFLEALDEGPSQ